MKKALFLFLGFLPFIANCQSLTDAKQPLVKKLVWAEEFDKNGLPDETAWNFEVGKARANNEPQYHTRDLKNVRVEDGKLIITTRLEEVDGVKKYTSARINTRGKKEFTNGRIEVRSKLPQGRGMWPAIWTLGLTGGWPACGDIDIMEYWGHDPNTVAANVHTGDYNHTKGTGRGGKITYEKPFEDFHIFAVEWFADRMDFFMVSKRMVGWGSAGRFHRQHPATCDQMRVGGGCVGSDGEWCAVRHPERKCEDGFCSVGDEDLRLVTGKLQRLTVKNVSIAAECQPVDTNRGRHLDDSGLSRKHGGVVGGAEFEPFHGFRIRMLAPVGGGVDIPDAIAARLGGAPE